MSKAATVTLKKVGLDDANKSGQTNKFWSAWTHGANFVANWGRNGTSGQTRSWPMGSPTAAERKLVKMVDSKLAKGYVYA